MRRLSPLVVPVVLIAVWWIIGELWPPLMDYLRLTSPELAASTPDLTFLSTPKKTFIRFVELLFDGTLLKHSVSSILRTFVAFAVASALGGLLGIVLAARESIENALLPTVEGIRSIPPIALLPIFILLAGIGGGLSITFSAFGSMWPVVIATHASIRRIDGVAFEVAKNLGLRREQILRRVVMPLMLPGYITGLRIALPLALILVIVAEMFVGGGVGLGAEIDYARRVFRFDSMMALIVTIGIVGILVNSGLAILERRLLWWDERFRRVYHDQ